MSEFSLLDWIFTIAAIAVSWQIHAEALHPPPAATSGQPQPTDARSGEPLPAERQSALGERLERIQRAGGYQDLPGFLSGAVVAYERIVAAFAEGELQPVLPMLGPAVREAFVSAVGEREARGEMVSSVIIGVAAEPLDAGIDGDTAWIEVRFVAELVSATTDRQGKVVAGSPQRVVAIAEAWTFARDVRSLDPNWTVIATAEDLEHG